jgi:hypothetical protein
VWSEILWVKPRLERSTAVKMENDLSTRFVKASKRFSHGLRNLMKGAILGFSIGLIEKVLNPLKEIEERIKNLGKKGQSATDLAEKFGTTPGAFLEFQAVGQALGNETDSITEHLQKFADAVILARKEIKSNEAFSPTTQIVSGFAKSSDMVAALRNFFENQSKLPQHQQDINNRLLFGEEASGSFKRLMQADFGKVRKEFKIPSPQALDSAAKNAGRFALKQAGQEVGIEERAFVKQSNQLNPKFLEGFLVNAELQKIRESNDNARIETLKTFERGANDVTSALRTLQKAVEYSGAGAIDGWDWIKKHWPSTARNPKKGKKE